MTLGSETGWGGPGVRFRGVRRAAGEGPRAEPAVAVAQAHPTLWPPGGPGSRAGRAGPAAEGTLGPHPTGAQPCPAQRDFHTRDLGLE